MGGKRAGSRRAAKKSSSFRPSLLGLAAAVTASVVAWGYLVYAAIDFGSAARGGESQAWLFLGLASLGAVACLFIGLMLVSRLMHRLGPDRSVPPPPRLPEEPVRLVGGRRAAR